jgi:hypothetical protein
MKSIPCLNGEDHPVKQEDCKTETEFTEARREYVEDTKARGLNCDSCGTEILHRYHFKRDGKSIMLGSSCLNKLGCRNAKKALKNVKGEGLKRHELAGGFDYHEYSEIAKYTKKIFEDGETFFKMRKHEMEYVSDQYGNVGTFSESHTEDKIDYSGTVYAWKTLLKKGRARTSEGIYKKAMNPKIALFKGVHIVNDHEGFLWIMVEEKAMDALLDFTAYVRGKTNQWIRYR